jgi:type II secretory pathway pseudopilin PulG
MNRVTGVRLLITGVCVAVVTAVVTAIVVLGSPTQQRQRRLDEHRVHDLSTIVNTISLYANTHDALPPELSALGKEPGPRRAPTDPGTGAAYEYAVLGTESYQLCAVFTLPSADTAATRLSPDLETEGWTHAPGRQCFERKQKIGKN